jgi:ribosomal-protein-alanine N-acetyltransferase
LVDAVRSVTSRIYVRAPALTDQRAFLALAKRSRNIHRPWVAAPSTPKQYRAFVERIGQPEHAGFIVCEAESDALVGVINISNIVLGAFRSGYLSYYVFAGFERTGLMTEGMHAVMRHAFGRLKLHRLEANIQPRNAASIALVKSCGFLKEGYSPRYLKIGGRWRDHERWAVLAS